MKVRERHLEVFGYLANNPIGLGNRFLTTTAGRDCIKDRHATYRNAFSDDLLEALAIKLGNATARNVVRADHDNCRFGLVTDNDGIHGLQ